MAESEQGRERGTKVASHRYWRTVYLVQLAAWMSYWIDNHVERGAGYRYAASTRRDVNGLVWATGMV